MGFMPAITLSDRVILNYSKVKIKKFKVRVPRLKIRKLKGIETKKNDNIPVSVIVNILIRAALEKAKREKENKPVSENTKYRLTDDSKDAPGGYGTASKHYGISPTTPYVDYGKLFGYLGKFRARNAYDSDIPTQSFGNLVEPRSVELVDRESMDKGVRYVKYFFPHAADFYVNLASLVPVAGMNSAEWEQFKLMMQLDPVMFKLKMSTS